MRLSTIAIWLYAVIGAVANNEAAPGELEYLYALYKAEWVVHGKDGARTIATGCEHKAKNWPTDSPTAITLNQRNQEDEDAFVAAAAALGVTGICAFDEFVKHIGVQSTFTKWKYDRAGHSIDPAWGGIKAKAGKAPVSSDLPLRYDFTLLFPGEFTATQSLAWAEGIRLANTKFRAFREAAMAAGKDVSAMVEKGLAYITFAEQVRIKDRENLATEKVQKYLQTQGVSKKNFFKFVQYTTVDFAGPDGRPNAVKIEEFNFDATVAKAAADEGVTTLTADQEAGMKQTVTDFEASPAYVEHNEVIAAMHEGVGSLTIDLAACTASSSKRKRGLFREKRTTMRPPHKRQAHLRGMFTSGLLVRSKFIY